MSYPPSPSWTVRLHGRRGCAEVRCSPIPTLHTRVRQGEIGSALNWHRARAFELGERSETFVVADTVTGTTGCSA